MSWVANVMISVDAADTAHVEALSEWLRTEARQRSQPETRGVGFLKPLTNAGANQWGGWKEPECEVWAGALNHADLDALKQRVLEAPWSEPDMVQLLVMDQEDAFFRLWMIRGNELRQFAPLEPNEENEGLYLDWCPGSAAPAWSSRSDPVRGIDTDHAGDRDGRKR